MNIYLEYRKKDIAAFLKAIKLCKENPDVVNVLKEYLIKIQDEYSYADYLKNSFIPLINDKPDFYRAFIFCTDSGDYNIEVYIHNATETAKKEYSDIYNKFCNENEETFFYFNVYDIEKDKDIYAEAKDYDKLTIKPNKKICLKKQ